MENRYRGLLIIVPIILLGMACSLGQVAANVGEQIADIERGSGEVVKEGREVGEFSRIDLSGLGDVQIEFGAREALTIEAEDNIIGLIETQTRGGILEIGIQEDVNIFPTAPIRIQVTAVNLEELTVSGAGSITADEIFTDNFKLIIDGLGNADIGELKAETLSVVLEGSGGITIHQGEVFDQQVSIEGLGSYDGGGLLSGTAEVDLSGAGNATVWATDQLAVTLSGVGNVSYYGDPKVSLNRSGLGSINSLGDK